MRTAVKERLRDRESSVRVVAIPGRAGREGATPHVRVRAVRRTYRVIAPSDQSRSRGPAIRHARIVEDDACAEAIDFGHPRTSSPLLTPFDSGGYDRSVHHIESQSGKWPDGRSGHSLTLACGKEDAEVTWAHERRPIGTVVGRQCDRCRRRVQVHEAPLVGAHSTEARDPGRADGDATGDPLRHMHRDRWRVVDRERRCAPERLELLHGCDRHRPNGTKRGHRHGHDLSEMDAEGTPDAETATSHRHQDREAPQPLQGASPTLVRAAHGPASVPTKATRRSTSSLSSNDPKPGIMPRPKRTVLSTMEASRTRGLPASRGPTPPPPLGP